MHLCQSESVGQGKFARREWLEAALRWLALGGILAGAGRLLSRQPAGAAASLPSRARGGAQAAGEPGHAGRLPSRGTDSSAVQPAAAGQCAATSAAQTMPAQDAAAAICASCPAFAGCGLPLAARFREARSGANGAEAAVAARMKSVPSAQQAEQLPAGIRAE